MRLVELFGFDELNEATQLRLINNYQPGKQAKREKKDLVSCNESCLQPVGFV